MNLPTWSQQEAQENFDAVIDAASRGAPQQVTRRDQPGVVVLAAEEYERLRRLDAGPKPSFVKHLLALPQETTPNWPPAPTQHHRPDIGSQRADP